MHSYQMTCITLPEKNPLWRKARVKHKLMNTTLNSTESQSYVPTKTKDELFAAVIDIKLIINNHIPILLLITAFHIPSFNYIDVFVLLISVTNANIIMNNYSVSAPQGSILFSLLDIVSIYYYALICCELYLTLIKIHVKLQQVSHFYFISVNI
eukprot:543437_1